MQEPKDPRMSGKIAMLALLLIAALTVVMVWVAG
jgi:predicted nucleic acid-binding Zn ribbon protein